MRDSTNGGASNAYGTDESQKFISGQEHVR